MARAESPTPPGVRARRPLEVARRERNRKGEPEPVPPRGPALDEEAMLLSFDVDCGELVGATGSSPGALVTLACWSGTEAGPRPASRWSTSLCPASPSLMTSGAPFAYLVGIDYEADVPLPWTPNDSGAIAPARDGPSTHGSRGTWPLPRSARILRFVLTGTKPPKASRPVARSRPRRAAPAFARCTVLVIAATEAPTGR